MYEIIADPEDYQIDHLVNGTGKSTVEISETERKKWAKEIENFSNKITVLAEKSGKLAQLLYSDQKITATHESFKTLKIQLFKINEKLENVMEIAERLESDIVKK